VAPVLVGHYDFGLHRVRLYADYTNNGGVDFAGESGLVEITVGVGSDWGRTVGTLLHEAMEKASMEVFGRYRPAPDDAWTSDSYVFIMDHAQYSQCCARAGDFMAQCLPELARVFHRMTGKPAPGAS
jgi:hypothetical protein